MANACAQQQVMMVMMQMHFTTTFPILLVNKPDVAIALQLLVCCQVLQDI